MFRIEFFVEDRDLAPVMHALAGRAKDFKAAPVVNAVATKDGVKAKTQAGSQLDLFKAYLDKMPAGADLARANVMEFLTKIGGNPTSSGGLLAQALKMGWLKRNGKAGRGHKNFYTVARGAK